MLRLPETYCGFTALDDLSARLSSGMIAPLKLGRLMVIANRIHYKWLAPDKCEDRKLAQHQVANDSVWLCRDFQHVDAVEPEGKIKRR
jgi:hypothetical protein